MYGYLANPLTSGRFGRRPRVMAHRGASGTCPENTLLAFQQAALDGADVLEMDSHLTADGEIVICHDPTVDRTTDGSGPVAAKTLAELKELDAGYRFSPDGGKTFPFRGKGIRIPTFKEVLESFPTMPINIELKADEPLMVAGFVHLLERFKRFNDVLVLTQAESGALMQKIRAAHPQIMTGHCRPEVLRFFILSRLHVPGLFKAQAPVMQVPRRYKWFHVATPDFVRHAHMLGMEVHVWTINEEEEMARLLRMGVDGLFTDFPGRMRKLLDSGKWKAEPHRR